jgi:hypothetical protein
MGEAIAQNEREIEVLAREIGFKQVIHLSSCAPGWSF